MKILPLCQAVAFRGKSWQLLALVLMLSFGAHAQSDDTTKVRQSIYAYGYDWQRGSFVKFLLPPRDSLKLKVADSGAIMVTVTPPTLYIWSGYTWKQASSNVQNLGDTALLINGDTIPINAGGTSIAHQYSGGVGLFGDTLVKLKSGQIDALNWNFHGNYFLQDSVVGYRVLNNAGIGFSMGLVGTNVTLMGGSVGNGFVFNQKPYIAANTDASRIGFDPADDDINIYTPITGTIRLGTAKNIQFPGYSGTGVKIAAIDADGNLVRTEKDTTVSGGSTDLSKSRTDTSVTVSPSAGTSAIIPPATKDSAGVATKRQVQQLDSAYNRLNGTSIYGTIYNMPSLSTLDTFVDNSSGASVSSGNIAFSGGGGNFSKYLSLKYNTCLNKWDVVTSLKITSSGTGLAVGLESYNAFFKNGLQVQYNFSNGNLVIWKDGGVVSTSASALSNTTNDSVELHIIRDGNMLTATIRNVTTGSAPISVSCQIGYGYTSIPNAGRFTLYNIGGACTVYKLNISTTETTGADVAILGDSKAAGYNASFVQYSFPYLLSRNYQTVINAGPADVTQSIVDRLPEIYRLKPKQALVCIGVNDISFSVSTGTWQANLHTIYDSLTAHGIRVVFINSLYDHTSSNTLRTYINSSFSSDVVIKAYEAGDQPGTVAGDNVHATDYGHYVAFSTVITSGKLWYGSSAAQKDSLFGAATVTGKLLLGKTRLLPTDAIDGDIVIPSGNKIIAATSNTAYQNSIELIDNVAGMNFRAKLNGGPGYPVFNFFAPIAGTGTQTSALKIYNDGNVEYGRKMLLGASVTVPSGAATNEIVLPQDGGISAAATGTSTYYNRFIPFTSVAAMELRNYFNGGGTFPALQIFTADAGTGTQSSAFLIYNNRNIDIAKRIRLGSAVIPAAVGTNDVILPVDGAITTAHTQDTIQAGYRPFTTGGTSEFFNKMFTSPTHLSFGWYTANGVNNTQRLAMALTDSSRLRLLYTDSADSPTGGILYKDFSSKEIRLTKIPSSIILQDGSGFRPVLPNNHLRTWFFGYGVNGDTTTNTNAITVTADTAEVASKPFVAASIAALTSTMDSIFSKTITTTDATPAYADTIYIPEGYMCVIECTYQGENTSNNETYVAKRIGSVKNIGGTIIIVGDAQFMSPIQETSLTTASVTLTAIDTNTKCVARVTGVAATTISWTVTYTKTYKMLTPL